MEFSLRESFAFNSLEQIIDLNIRFLIKSYVILAQILVVFARMCAGCEGQRCCAPTDYGLSDTGLNLNIQMYICLVCLSSQILQILICN